MKKIITITIHMSDMTKAEKKLINDFVTMEGLTHDRDNGRRHLFDAVYRGDAAITITEQRGWKAGWNVPGYLPDDEPGTFDTWESACGSLVEELERACDDRQSSADTEAKAADIRDMYHDAIAQVRAAVEGAESTPFWVKCGKYVWWVAQEQ